MATYPNWVGSSLLVSAVPDAGGASGAVVGVMGTGLPFGANFPIATTDVAIRRGHCCQTRYKSTLPAESLACAFTHVHIFRIHTNGLMWSGPRSQAIRPFHKLLDSRLPRTWSKHQWQRLQRQSELTGSCAVAPPKSFTYWRLWPTSEVILGCLLRCPSSSPTCAAGVLLLMICRCLRDLTKWGSCRFLCDLNSLPQALGAAIHA